LQPKVQNFNLKQIILNQLNSKMKTKNLHTLGIVFVAAVGLVSCNGLGKMVKKADTVTYTVTPQPLEMHGDTVAVTISGKYPPKYFGKKVVLTVTPKIGEHALKALTLVGEKATGAGTKIAFKAGGSFSYSDRIAYTPDMKNTDLKIGATGVVKSKSKEIPAKKIGDGTIITPLLTTQDEKAILGPDKFVKVLPVSADLEIFFIINESTVRPSEISRKETKDFKAFCKRAENKGFAMKGMSVSAYASPDGELSKNANLAEERAKHTIKAMMDELKKDKVNAGKEESFYTKSTTAEDWDGFKKLMEASDIKDKDLILRVLTMYTDGDQREKEIKNLSQTWTVLKEKILPKLRRSVSVLNCDSTGRTDERISQLATSSPDSLNNEEILYAATLTKDMNTKMTIYKAAEKRFPNDWRSANNVAYIALMQNKAGDAETELQKADKLSPNNPAVMNNLGIVSRWKGDRKKAKDYYSKAGSSPEVSYNLGVIAILDGKYSDAVSKMNGANTFNSALAKVLAGQADAGAQTLDNSPVKDDALSYYLKAVIGARTSKTDMVISNLKAAIAKDGAYKDMARTDLEFFKQRDNADFKSITQ
jgi:Flp pilus assembly protein TadD